MVFAKILMRITRLLMKPAVGEKEIGERNETRVMCWPPMPNCGLPSVPSQKSEARRLTNMITLIRKSQVLYP